ncbi:MAG: bacteriohemerythrin [Treponema sp.]|jgi:hemerythrin|nr:bacteriohemerythrin [Treponema sp.]
MPKSELVKWSATYSVGIKLIDDQHKGLLDLVNDLFNHVSADEATERAYFQKVIQTAVNYVKVHFATEEKIMLATRFPGYAEHKKAHDTFVLTVVDSIRDFEAGKKFTLAGFTRFLKDWVLTHIAIMDKQYFTYFKQIASRKANGRLTINHGDLQSR